MRRAAPIGDAGTPSNATFRPKVLDVYLPAPRQRREVSQSMKLRGGTLVLFCFCFIRKAFHSWQFQQPYLHQNSGPTDMKLFSFFLKPDCSFPNVSPSSYLGLISLCRLLPNWQEPTYVSFWWRTSLTFSTADLTRPCSASGTGNNTGMYPFRGCGLRLLPSPDQSRLPSR